MPDNITFKKGINYLISKDEIFHSIYKEIGILPYEPRLINFSEFCSIIIGQQLSSKAASTIFKRLENTFKSKIFNEDDILSLDIKTFRKVGISSAKTFYIKSFAEKIKKEPNFFSDIGEMQTDKAFNNLIELNGVGPWTANIIQLFYLGDLNIFPFGDVSLEKVYSRLYATDLNSKKKSSYDHISWSSPFKGILAIYLWKYLDNGLFES